MRVPSSTLAFSLSLLLGASAARADTPPQVPATPVPATPVPATPSPATPAPATPAAAGPTATGPTATGPVIVKVGLYLMNVGKLDVASGSYTADFYLTLSSDRDMGDPRIEFLNGRATSTDVLLDTPTEKQLRVQANLMTNLNLARFPWDAHELPVVLESATRRDDDLLLVPSDKEGIDPAVVFVGWDVKGYTSSVEKHSYAVFQESYSTYTFKLRIARVFLTSSLKTFLPVLCFLMIAFCALIVGTEKLDSRIAMNTAMLIASVMFHLSITNQLPPAAYLTIADKVMVATYLTIGLSLALSVWMMRHMQAGRTEEAKRLREHAFRIVPGFTLGAFVIVALLSR